ncbi:MAG: fibronectin type III domain-containing protein [Betaproteobacteria bacterium]|nr:fibronectin type III domain-containing protein [Betaproteobacteria bacterium]
MFIKEAPASIAALNLKLAVKWYKNLCDRPHARRSIAKSTGSFSIRFPARVLLAIFAASTLAAYGSSSPTQSIHKPRLVLTKPAEVIYNENKSNLARLIVKFAEGSEVRFANGAFLQRRDVDSVPRRATDISHINNALKARPALLRSGAVNVERLFSRAEASLNSDRESGMAKSGEELADLNLYHVITFDASTAPADALALANSLIKLGIVETAYFEPKSHVNATDIAPSTPAFENLQNHLDRAYDGKTIDPKIGLLYSGIDAKYAWTFQGGRGAGTKFIDIEFGWDTNHEDLNTPTILRDPDTSDQWHGTAVIGLINAQSNAYGMTGIASDAKYGLVNVAYGATGQVADNLALAINRASSYTAPGDVILIEVGIDFDYQSAGCTYPYYTGVATVPVEHYQAVFDAIKTATANGTVVIETASNGSANLDDPCFGNRYNTAFRDSGAIMVGASVKGSLQRVLTSSHGSRIDVQAQGNLVSTTVSTANFNNLFAINPPDENQQYTSLFDGTSAAGAIVAGTVLSLQGIQKARNGHTFTPAQMRMLLKAHGTDPVTYNFLNNGIGPMPNLRATIDWMSADADGNGTSNGDELSSGRKSIPVEYVVTATAGPNGTITPASTLAPALGTVSLTATPNVGYVAIFRSGSCPAGATYGNNYKTGQIVGNCAVSVVFETILAAPANVAVKTGNRSASFKFVSPVSDPQAPITSFTVSCNGGAFHGTAATSPVRVTGLTNGTSYSCIVTAQNSAGFGAPSSVVYVTPIAGANSVSPIHKST